ncbi:hypothetical protein ACIGDM_02805 [Rothia koreensis]|uniref:hypothetical protein n=1 Tax=Rothia koreensis TaxID=592378 RepID=UPI0015BA7196
MTTEPALEAVSKARQERDDADHKFRLSLVDAVDQGFPLSQIALVAGMSRQGVWRAVQKIKG